MNVEPIRPNKPMKNAFKPTKIPTHPYYQEPTTSVDYIYQQTMQKVKDQLFGS